MTSVDSALSQLVMLDETKAGSNATSLLFETFASLIATCRVDIDFLNMTTSIS